MIKKILLSIITLFLTLTAMAESWDEVVTSKDYYHGIGRAETPDEAKKLALEEMMTSIVVHVSNDFQLLQEDTNVNGNIDSKTRVRNCLNTYSQGSFTNVRYMTQQGKGKEVRALCYMQTSELDKIYQLRIDAAKTFIHYAEEALKNKHIDAALRNYYAAYAYIRSLQHPYQAKDDKGEVLAVALPNRIREILKSIRVNFDKQEDEFIYLNFTYNGEAVSSIDFTYNDGVQDLPDNTARDGKASFDMAPGYEENNTFHIKIEYEYKSQSRGDKELYSVLNVIPTGSFIEAKHQVERNNATKQDKPTQNDTKKVVETKFIPAQQTQSQETSTQKVEELKPSASQQPNDITGYANSMSRIMNAIKTREMSSVYDLFDADGQDVYNQLQKYGSMRLIGEPNLSYINGRDGSVTVRGMNVSFSFTSPKKVTFTEELIFTFNKEGKVNNIAFGLGKVAEEDILYRHPKWDDAVKEQIMEFMENYKTAYCLKRLDYIRDIFADDAVIIVGKVTHRNGSTTNIGEQQITQFGRSEITKNRYTKDEYLKNLEKCFNNPRNKYINVKFEENEVQTLKPINGHKVFGIQIKQLYNSATYGDIGYLFLMVDMTNPDEPQIKVRTWQPNQTPMDEIYNAGYFYND